jgi:Kef-type K+ transport system membrane component KefB
MIIFGMVARNEFGAEMKNFPSKWGSLIRSFSLVYLLFRGGLTVTFSGNILRIAMLSIIPQFFEAQLIAWTAYGSLGWPPVVCFCISYVLACVSPSVTVPILTNFLDQNRGKKKGIVPTLIASATCEDILCIICFGIVKSIAINE